MVFFSLLPYTTIFDAIECAFPYLRKRGATSRKSAVCTRRLTEKRSLHRRRHRNVTERRILGVSLSRKSALCVWASPKGAFCMRAVVAPRAHFRRSVYTLAYPRPLSRPGGGHGSHDIEGPMAPVMSECPDLRSMPPGR